MIHSTILPKCARDECSNLVKRKGKRFCSNSCATSVRNTKPKVTVTCQQCKTKYDVKPSIAERSKFCSKDCKHKYQETLVAEKHPRYQSVKKECKQCGKEFACQPHTASRTKFCGQVCRRLYHKSKRPGGPRTNIDYGPRWKLQRLKCLIRDKYTCQRCGKTKEQLGKTPDVHHKVPYKISRSNRLRNLITLCKSCHSVVEPRVRKA